jgi:glutaredoxin
MIQVYGRRDPPCAFCDRAKALLESRGLDYAFLSMPEDLSLIEFQARFPGRKTIPQIVVNGRLLEDGYASLVEELDGGFGHDF